MSDAGEDGAAATFEVERFAWATPDQLELTGRFSGLADVRSDAPALVMRGERETHRLSAVGEALAWPPEDGQAWSAAFAWSEAPAPFAAAELDLGDGRHLELPEPGARRSRFGRRVLEVRDVDAEAAERTELPEEAPAGPDAEPPEPAVAVGLCPDLVLAREETHAAAARARDAEEEVARARADLQAEHERRAAHAERFGETLAVVRETAVDALEAERLAHAELANDLRAAHADAQARACAKSATRSRLGSSTPAERRARRPTRSAACARRELLQGKLESAERAAVDREDEVGHLHERLASIRRARSEEG